LFDHLQKMIEPADGLVVAVSNRVRDPIDKHPDRRCTVQRNQILRLVVPDGLSLHEPNLAGPADLAIA